MVARRRATRSSRSGARAELRAPCIRTPPRSGPRARCCRALVNAHCHLELSALAGAVPGGGGLVAWARRLMALAAAPIDAGARRRGGRRGGRALRALRDRRRRRRRQQPGGGAGHRRRRAARHLLPRAGRLARGAHRRRARRRRPRARPTLGRADAWPAGLGLRAGAARALLGRARAAPPRSSPSPRAPALPTSVHVAEDRDELALLRDGSGALAGGAGGAWASIRATRVARPGAGRLPGVAGRLRRAGAAAAGAHGPRRRRGPAPRARGRRHRGAVPALEPAHRRRAARRRRAAATTASRWRSAPTAWRRRPTCRCGARWRRWRARFPRVPAAAWLDAATRGGARALGLAPLRRAGARASAPASSTCSSTSAARAALECAGARPATRRALEGARMSACTTATVAATPRAPTPAGARPARHVAVAVRAHGQVQPHGLRAAVRAGGRGAGRARPRPVAARACWRIVVAMAGARTAAMGFNRIVDRRIDARNPRTAGARAPCRRGLAARRLDADAGQRRACSWARRRSWARCAWRCRRSRWRCCSATRSPSASRSCATCSWAWPSPPGPAGAWIAVRGDFGWPPGAADDRGRHLDRRLRHPVRARRRDFDRERRPALDPGALRRRAARSSISGVAARGHRRRADGAGAPPRTWALPYLAGVAVVVALLVWEHAIVRPTICRA